MRYCLKKKLQQTTG